MIQYPTCSYCQESHEVDYCFLKEFDEWVTDHKPIDFGTKELRKAVAARRKQKGDKK